jgi:WD40 repeat protein
MFRSQPSLVLSGAMRASLLAILSVLASCSSSDRSDEVAGPTTQGNAAAERKEPRPKPTADKLEPSPAKTEEDAVETTPRFGVIDPPLTDAERLAIRRPYHASATTSGDFQPLERCSMALAPDRAALLLASASGELSVFDYRAGRLVHRSQAHTVFEVGPDWNTIVGIPSKRSAWTIANLSSDASTPLTLPKSSTRVQGFAPDGKALWLTESGISKAKSGRESTCSMWDLQQRKARFQKKGNLGPAAFSPDSKILALTTATKSPTEKPTLELLDANTGAVQRTVPLDGLNVDVVQQVLFSPKGDFLAMWGESRGFPRSTRIAVFHFAEGKWRWNAELPSPEPTRPLKARVTISADGRLILLETSRSHFATSVLDAATGEVQFETDRFRTATFSSDGKLLAAGGREPTVLLLPTDTWQVGEGLEHGFEECTGVCFSRRGRELAVKGSNKGDGVAIYNIKTREMLARISDSESVSGRLQFTPDGRRLLCAANDGTLRIIDPAGQREPLALCGPDTATLCVATNKDGTRILTGGKSGIVLLRDAASGKIIHRLKGAKAQIRCVGFTDDGATAVAVDRDKALLWDAAMGALKKESQLHNRGSDAAGISPDGSLLISGGTGPVYSQLAAFGCPALNTIFSLDKEDADDIAISPNNSLMATGHQHSQDISLRSTKDGALIRTFPGRRSAAGGLAFSADGRLLAMGTAQRQGAKGNQVAVIDVASGDVIAEHRQHKMNITSVAISPQADLVASVDSRGVVLIAECKTGKVVRELKLEPTIALPQLPGAQSESGSATK